MCRNFYSGTESVQGSVSVLVRPHVAGDRISPVVISLCQSSWSVGEGMFLNEEWKKNTKYDFNEVLVRCAAAGTAELAAAFQVSWYLYGRVLSDIVDRCFAHVCNV